ncbi:MAG: polysaccharide biosynthesis C-terminal domain-containing protein, partial [Chitinophagales bacterium]
SSKYYKWNLALMPFLAIISISLNVYFISNYQFIGAAIATFISILVFNLMRTLVVYLKLGLNPFFLNYFKVIPFILLPFALSYFIKFQNLYLNAILTSFFIAVFFILPLYKLKLSEEFNKLLDQGIKKIMK